MVRAGAARPPSVLLGGGEVDAAVVLAEEQDVAGPARPAR